MGISMPNRSAFFPSSPPEAELVGEGWTALKLLIVLFLPLLPLALLASPLRGQTREKGPIILELPSSTRGMALGGAFALGFTDPDVVFYHPGAMDRGRGFSASVHRYGTDATLTGLSAGTDWYDGSVVVGVRHLSYGADAGSQVGPSDLLALPDDPGSLQEDGATAVSEAAVSVGYARSVLGLRAGVVGKLVEQRFGHLNAATAAVDLGVSASPGPFTVALSAQNLGRVMKMGGEEISLPARLILGATSRRAPVGPLDLALSSTVIYRMEGDVIPGGGVEVAYWPVTGRTFVARAGYRHLPDHWSNSPLTFGAAFFGDDIVLEYAYEGFDSYDPSHRFSIGWR